jgi:hypothetical protein
MRGFSIFVSLIIIGLCLPGGAKKNAQGVLAAQTQTEVTFVVEERDEKDNDIISISLKLAKDDPSLSDAIEKATELSSSIKAIFVKFCLSNAEEPT